MVVKVLKRITDLELDELIKEWEETKNAIRMYQFTDKVNNKVLDYVFDLQQELKSRGIVQ